MQGVMDRTYVRRLGLPRPIHVTTDQAGLPVAVANRPVSVTRDEWRVEEGWGGRRPPPPPPVSVPRAEWGVEGGWWPRRPVPRPYFDLVLADGRNPVVFCDRRQGRWYEQRA